MSRTLEQNLDVLRMLDGDDLVAVIEQLPRTNRADAAAYAVRTFFPAHDAILSASREAMLSVVGGLSAEEMAR